VRVKPEDLRAANKIAHLKETSSTASKRNYWNGVCRLITEGRYLVLKTQDGMLWIEWYIPIEEEPLQMDVIVQNEAFDHAARYLEGGSLSITREGGLVTLSKQQLHYRMREESPQTYLEPTAGANPVVWETDSRPLARALRFVAQFIDDTNPQENKNCATLYWTGS